MSLRDNETKAKVDMVETLGSSWFSFESDIEPDKLGKELKTYSFNLGFNDFFRVIVHEKGAEMYYTVTGAIKYTKNVNLAFQMARQMKGRNREVSRLLETRESE